VGGEGKKAPPLRYCREGSLRTNRFARVWLESSQTITIYDATHAYDTTQRNARTPIRLQLFANSAQVVTLLTALPSLALPCLTLPAGELATLAVSLAIDRPCIEGQAA